MILKFGNLLPKAQLKLKLTLLTQLKIYKASYLFEVTFAFRREIFPYGNQDPKLPFDFSSTVTIESD